MVDARRQKQKYYVLASVCVVGVALGAILFFALRGKGNALGRQELLDRMDAARINLRATLVDRTSRRDMSARAYRGGGGAAGAYSSADPERKVAIEGLRALLEEFQARFGNAGLLGTGDLRLRLTRASLANAEERYDATLNMITERDLTLEDAAKGPERAFIIEANELRGDALYASSQWQQARVCYENILDVAPGRWRIRRASANCLYKLDRKIEAGAQYDMVIDALTRLVDGAGETDLSEALAAALGQRGIARADDGQPVAALEDFDRSIQLYERLVEKEDGRKELSDKLAAVLVSRGNARWTNRQYELAFPDYDEAIQIFNRLVEHEDRTDLVIDLAEALSERGARHMIRARHAEALVDVARAVEIYSRLVEQQGRTELVGNLAASLNMCGNLRRRSGERVEAVQDHDRAVELYNWLIQQGDVADAASQLASALNNRGLSHSHTGNLVAAIQDFDEAITLCTRLIEREGRQDLAGYLKMATNNRKRVAIRLERRANQEK